MTLLAVDGLVTGYGRKQVTFEVSLRVAAGEIVALMGHNGAGKTTTLKAIAGLLPAWSGAITFDGRSITHASSARRVRHGLSLVPQEHFVFADLTVAENSSWEPSVSAIRGRSRPSAARSSPFCPSSLSATSNSPAPCRAASSGC